MAKAPGGSDSSMQICRKHKIFLYSKVIRHLKSVSCLHIYSPLNFNISFFYNHIRKLR
jgi:hypothetical protein